MDKSENYGRRSRRTVNSGSERKGFRSLICDESGIVIGEMVYRCLICSYINESMDKVRSHYQTEHDNIEDISNGELRYINGEYSPSPANSYVDDTHNTVDEVEQEEPARVPSYTTSSYTTKSRSGYITCTVCSSTRFYSYVQRRYGQYTCSACYRHFREFLIKPKIYSCSNLGKCSMDLKNKCRACWLLTCINVYGPNVDEERREIMLRYRPVKEECGKECDQEENEKEENHLEKEDEDVDDGEEGEDDDGGEGEDEEEEGGEEAEEKEEEEEDSIEIDKLSEGELTVIKEMSPVDGDGNHEASSIHSDSFEQSELSSNNVKRNLELNVQKIFKKVESKRKRNWSCMKCANCLKEECGKCIYCLDRPKYGGTFRLRQRCANRRCLLKLKDL